MSNYVYGSDPYLDSLMLQLASVWLEEKLTNNTENDILYDVNKLKRMDDIKLEIKKYKEEK